MIRCRGIHLRPELLFCGPSNDLATPTHSGLRTSNSAVKRTIEGMALAGEPLLREALEAIRAFHQAEDDGASADELGHLRLLADSLYQTVLDYQLRVSDDLTAPLH